MNWEFYRGKKVFVTGHTGFKGAWLTAMLHSMGAIVMGFSPKAAPGSLFEAIGGDSMVESVDADVRDKEAMCQAMERFQPQIVIHLAARAIVGDCYAHPWDAYSTNIMGTVNLFEAIRQCASVRSVLIITTDKVYENHGDSRMYVETDKLGCDDTYGCSKACMEMITEAYKNTYFRDKKTGKLTMGISTARAGNVLGGGDREKSRLIPSILQSFADGEVVELRHPTQTRPWQHVLEALDGYLTIAREMYEDPEQFSSQWNIGPYETGIKDVAWMTETICRLLGNGATYTVQAQSQYRESATLGLDITKALRELDWKPRLTTEEMLFYIVEFFRGERNGEDPNELCQRQIQRFYGK